MPWHSACMAVRVAFSAELWLYQGEGGWHFVTLPPDAADEIDEAVPERHGFGSVKVSATIGASTWSTSVFPDSKSTSFVLPVKKAVRAANGLEAGDVVDVVLEVAG